MFFLGLGQAEPLTHLCDTGLQVGEDLLEFRIVVQRNQVGIALGEPVFAPATVNGLANKPYSFLCVSNYGVRAGLDIVECRRVSAKAKFSL